MRRRLALPSDRVREHFFHDVASGELGLKTIQGVEVTARLTVRMIGEMKARLVTMRALRPAILVRGETDVQSLRDAIDLIVKVYRASLRCALVYWDATATQRNSNVLTTKSGWVWPAIRMSESACEK
jgi:hypothetical protein